MKLRTLILFAALGLTSCSQDPSTSPKQGAILPMPVSSPAHPAFLYIGEKTVGNNIYQTIAVMDTDCTHQTNLYTSPYNSGTTQPLNAGKGHATWSYDGSKISFVEGTNNAFVNNLRVMSFSVLNGVPTGGTPSTIYTTTASDSASMTFQAFSSTSINKIAMPIVQNTSNVKAVKLYTIPSSGGTPTLLASVPTYGLRTVVGGVTWSPNDAQIAFSVTREPNTRYTSTWYSTIYIINTSTGAIDDSIALPTSYSPIGLEWSRTGQNVLAFAKHDTLNNRVLNYYDATAKTTSTGATGGVTMNCWSPNNSSVLLTDRYNLLKSTAFGTDTTKLLSYPDGNGFGYVNWKR